MKRWVLLALVVLLSSCTFPGRPAASTVGPRGVTANLRTSIPATEAPAFTPTPIQPPPTPPAVPSPSPYPVASPSPRTAGELVVYAREGTLWAYDGLSSRILTTAGPAAEPLLSPDGRRVLYRRPEAPTGLAAEPFSLWLLDVSTGQETAVDLAALPSYPFDFEGRTLALPRWPQQVAWMPDGKAVLFNTRVDFSMVGPGGLLGDDLWQVDAATGQVRNLFPEQAPPASFTISPDGAWLLVSRPTRIEAVRLATGERRTLVEFPAVATYSEYAWLPEPRWLPDGRTAQVSIAPADPAQSTTFALWRVDVEKGTATQFGQVEGMVFAWSPDGRSWSPDGTRLAYVSSPQGQPQVTLMSLGQGTTGAAASVAWGETPPHILGWSPDGRTVLVQGGKELYGVTAGPGIQAQHLFDVGVEPVQLYGSGNILLVSTGEGRLFQVTPDGSGIKEIP